MARSKKLANKDTGFRWITAGPGIVVWTDAAPEQEEIMANLAFIKTGKEIKESIQNRREQLQTRLDARNKALDEFMKDTRKVRSYLVRSTEPSYGHHGGRGYVLYGEDDISSEERREIDQLCQRIHEIEQELHRLELIGRHLRDKDAFNLSIEDLIGYGFDTSIESGF